MTITDTLCYIVLQWDSLIRRTTSASSHRQYQHGCHGYLHMMPATSSTTLSGDQLTWLYCENLELYPLLLTSMGYTASLQL